MIIQLIKEGDYKVQIMKGTFPSEGPVVTMNLGEFRSIFGEVYEELIEKEFIYVVPVLDKEYKELMGW